MEGAGILDKIQIKNVRSLKDTGEVSLAPITLLVGENSSGKSTFLRLFPLLKQSITKRTDGPLLWAGDVDDYVDFGSFSETVTNDGSEDMTFCFSFKISTQLASRLPRHLNRTQMSQMHLPRWHDISYSITIAQKNEREHVARLDVRVDKAVFSFDANERITVDTRTIVCTTNATSHFTYGLDWTKPEVFGYELPVISNIVDKVLRKFTDGESEYTNEEHYAFTNQRRFMFQYVFVIGQFLCLGESWEATKKKLIAGSGEYAKGYQRFIDCIDKMSESEASEFFDYFKVLFFYDCFTRIEEYLSVYFHRVHYIAPLRATAERYYRLRNLAIDEVDYQGKNLAIYLNSLSDERLHSFQTWTEQYFGFSINVERSVGHLSLQISLVAGGDPVKLSDTGFGYSQILPIITQLWDLSTHPRTSRYRGDMPLIIAIEQPELHLHPALQAKLAKVFLASIDVAKKNGYLLQLLIETHSETIVNYFGTAIASGTLKSDDVSVIMFDKSLGDLYTKVSTSNYDKDGYLTDWPIGFFSPKEW